jgi:hypothetical protein
VTLRQDLQALKIDSEHRAEVQAHTIERLQRELRNARRIVWALVKQAGGAVTLPERVLADLDDAAQLETQRMPNGDTVLRCAIDDSGA